MFTKQIRPAFFIFLILTIITGVIYPLVVTGIAQGLFSRQANGSIIYKDGKPIGSRLIGQDFSDPKYFWGRISATTPPYNAASSGGSNFGPLNPELIDVVKARVKALKEADPENINLVPVDLVTSSASGLDPHISLAAAFYQIPRVARIRNMPPDEIKNAVMKCASRRLLGLIGEPVVNVLELNLELDEFK
ncbi:MAG: potassium-transporting ATPase subunit KdpC [bacterium]|nr:potassium-transporting ATPase subunit KdpC [bacterium]